MLEMRVARENVRDAGVLHNDLRREIDEGDVGFVILVLAYLPGMAKLRRRDMDHPERAGVNRR